MPKKATHRQYLLSRHPEPVSYRHPEPEAKDLVVIKEIPASSAGQALRLRLRMTGQRVFQKTAKFVLCVTILFVRGWGSTLAQTPSTLISGSLHLSFQGTEEDRKRLLPEHLLEIALIPHIENELSQLSREDALTSMVWHLKDTISSYRTESFTVQENLVSYTLAVNWSHMWNSFRQNASASIAQVSKELTWTPYLIVLEDRLPSLLQKKRLDILQAIENHILIANTTYPDVRALVPALSLDRMPDSPAQYTTVTQTLCQSAPGYFEFSYAAKSSALISYDVKYIPCASLILNPADSTPSQGTQTTHPRESITLLSKEHISTPTLFSSSPSQESVVSLKPLYENALPDKDYSKIYLLHFNLAGTYSEWSRLYKDLSKSLQDLTFVEGISLYSLSKKDKTLQWMPKTPPATLPDNYRSVLTQTLVSFCEKHFDSGCNVAFENSTTREAWHINPP